MCLRDKLVSRNGVFDSNNVGISEVANESASDLMTSSDEEQGNQGGGGYWSKWLVLPSLL